MTTRAFGRPGASALAPCQQHHGPRCTLPVMHRAALQSPQAVLNDQRQHATRSAQSGVPFASLRGRTTGPDSTNLPQDTCMTAPCCEHGRSRQPKRKALMDPCHAQLKPEPCTSRFQPARYPQPAELVTPGLTHRPAPPRRLLVPCPGHRRATAHVPGGTNASAVCLLAGGTGGVAPCHCSADRPPGGPGSCVVLRRLQKYITKWGRTGVPHAVVHLLPALLRCSCWPAAPCRYARCPPCWQPDPCHSNHPRL